MVFGDGVAPIFASLLNLCNRSDKSLVIPSGSYGYFKAAAEFKNVELCTLKTSEENQFKIHPEQLQQCLSQRKGCWLFINAPIVNPTGAIYSSDELSNLFELAIKYEVNVVMDCIFSGLEFIPNMKWDLAQSIQKFSLSEKANLILIGGFSKEFSAGGLRFGYAWSTSKIIVEQLNKELVHQPHFTLGYSARKLVKFQLAGEQRLVKHLDNQRKLLKQRADTLSQVLINKGWQVIEPQGGLFLVAKPQSFIDENKLSDREGGDQMTQKLFSELNIVINNSTWTGLPGYCRFVLSCAEDGFSQAISRLQQY